MALTIDAVSSSGGSGAGPFTHSHTCTSADLLVVGVSWFDNLDSVTGVTYNSVSMTAIPSTLVTIGDYKAQAYYLLTPSAGTNTISASAGGVLFDFGMGAISFVGAHQTTPFGTVATATGTSTTPSVTVSSASGEIIFDVLTITHSGTLSIGAGQTSRWNAIGGAGFLKYASSTEGGGASVTMSWSNSSSQDWAMVGIPVKPAGASSFQAAWARGSNVLIGMN